MEGAIDNTYLSWACCALATVMATFCSWYATRKRGKKGWRHVLFDSTNDYDP